MQKEDNKITTLMTLIKSFGYTACVVLVIFGTYIFTIKKDSRFVVPYILCSCFYAFIIIYYLISTLVIPVMTRDIDDKRDSIKIKIALSDIYCLFLTWFFWITYGVVFRDIGGAFGTAWNYIQTFVLIFFMMISYLPCVMKNKIYIWSIIAMYSIVVVFFFSKDGISYNLNGLVLMSKSFLFCICYIVNDYKLQLPANIIEAINLSINKRLGTREQMISDVECGLGLEFTNNFKDIKEQILRMRAISLIRSYWILTCADRIVPFSLFQILPILIYSYSKCVDVGKKNENKIRELKIETKQRDTKPFTKPMIKKIIYNDNSIKAAEDESDYILSDDSDKNKKVKKVKKQKKDKKTKRNGESNISPDIIEALRLSIAATQNQQNQ